MKDTYYSHDLPDPLLRPDGTRVQNAEEWEAQKTRLRALAQAHMYGEWPGRADAVEATPVCAEADLDGRAIRETVRLNVVYRGRAFDMDVMILRPNDNETHPVIVANSFSFDPKFRCESEADVVARGYALASFLMNQLVPDAELSRYFHIPIDETRVYPSLPCRTIMAWAWGHSVVADYVTTRPYCGKLISTGASRGGKAALCAAIFDERFAVAAPTIAGCGGTGSARFCGTTDGTRQNSEKCETIGRITHVYADWFNDRYATYGSAEAPYPIGDEVNFFPLDANVLRAMVAPRAVFSSDGEEDHWSNPFGTQLGWMAAQPVFDLLGVARNNGFHIRPGIHGFDKRDWLAMLDFCDQVFGRPLPAPHEDLNKPYFDIDIRQYAGWMT